MGTCRTATSQSLRHRGMLVILHHPTACHQVLIELDASAMSGVCVAKKLIVLTRCGYGCRAHERSGYAASVTLAARRDRRDAARPLPTYGSRATIAVPMATTAPRVAKPIPAVH